MYPKQEAAFFGLPDQLPKRFALTEASTKAGKTVAGIWWITELALFTGKPGQNYWWVAPVFPQAKIAYNRTVLMCANMIVSKRASDLSVVLRSGAIIQFKSGEKPDNLYGEDVYGAVVDEASRLREEAWHALRSTITATRAPVRFIGNVKGRKNWFYAMCRKAEAGAKGMSYHKIIAADAIAAGVLDEEEIEGARRDLPDNVFRELYLAEPSDDGGNPFGLADIRACIAPLSGKAPRFWGWDLAKHVDWTVGIALDDEGAVCRFHRFQKPWDDTMKVMVKETGHVKALVDSTGVGDPVLELLQKNPGTKFEGFNFNQSSKQKLMEGLAVKIQSQEISFPEGVISDELEEFTYEYTRTGVRYTAPEGFHDDCVMALALASMHAINKPAPMKARPDMLQRLMVTGVHGRVPHTRLG